MDPRRHSWHPLTRRRTIPANERRSCGPQREKTCLRGFRRSEIQISLLGYKNQLVTWTFARSKSRYDSFQFANNKGADQTARMRRLVCAFVVRKPPKPGFSRRGSCFNWRSDKATANATGPDLLPARVLKELASEISTKQTALIPHRSFDTGYVPVHRRSNFATLSDA